MKRALIAACIALGLWGCNGMGPTVATTAAVVTPAVLTPAQLSAVQQECQAAGPLLNAATASTAPSTVSGVAIYPAAYCSELLSTGAPPATTNTTTPSWLSGVLSATQTAASIAGMVLPLIGAL